MLSHIEPSDTRLATLRTVLDGLMQRYQERVPDVSAVIQTMIDERLIDSAADIENDHVAFRTLGLPPLGIGSLEKIFLHFGYVRRDRYNFPKKKLTAYWYAPPHPEFPRIFISELRVNELPEEAQAIIADYTGDIIADPVDELDLDDADVVDTFLHQPLWRLPTWEDYRCLLDESEYAAWVIYNRYYLNHFTVAVHNLPAPYNTIEAFNHFLEQHGFQLNDANGKIKVSSDGKLIQSSLVAQTVDATFSDGKDGFETHQIAGSYVEFAERRPLDDYAHLPPDQLTREQRREGFDAGNADGIFESTYTAQTGKRASG